MILIELEISLKIYTVTCSGIRSVGAIGFNTIIPNIPRHFLKIAVAQNMCKNMFHGIGQFSILRNKLCNMSFLQNNLPWVYNSTHLLALSIDGGNISDQDKIEESFVRKCVY